jgi:serine/threonine-protein kinase
MTESRCPADEDLLSLTSGEKGAPEIQAHLEICPRCQQRLAALQAEVSNLRRMVQSGILSEPIPPAIPSAAEPPSTIGKYLILGVTTEGYHAFHPTLRMELVIKVAPAPVAEETAERYRLIAEGLRLANIAHAGLARVYDLDFHEQRPFLVWEHVRGPTLQEEFAGRPAVSPRHAAALTLQVAGAVEALHQQGILQLSLTPSSLRLDSKGQPRLVDPGLSLLNYPTPDTDVAYLAPEQARGQMDLDRHTDVFHLGGLLFFLLTGEAPFAAPMVEESLERARRGEFNPGALRGAGVARRLEAICLRALANQPADRYEGARAFAADLKWFLQRPRMMAWGLMLVTLGLLVLALWWLFPQG